MPSDSIKIRGARAHNLQNIDVDIPKGKLVSITGLSGSGKSSLAFDTLYAEGQRRYVESLSAYARQFLGVMDKPDVDSIEGISPAIAIDQRKGSHNPRSTVGTTTEIYDHLRLLFARTGVPHCPKCGKVVKRQSVSQIAKSVNRLPVGTEIMVMGPVVRSRKGEHKAILEEVSRSGFIRVRIDGTVWRLDEALEQDLDRKRKHDIEVVVDRMPLEEDLDKLRLTDSLETALKLGKGIVVVQAIYDNEKKEEFTYSEHFACDTCFVNLPEIEPRLFSFNSPQGACPSCHGLGEKLEVDVELVIPNPRLSIAEGAIIPWARASHRIGRQGYFWSKLKEVADKHGFDVMAPVEKLSKQALDKVLHGTEDFEGVVPWLERRYMETDSDFARDEIEQYMIEKVCEECQGKRLRPEVLSVLVAGHSIDDVVSMELTHAKEFFDGLSMSSSDQKIAKPIMKEVQNRLQFLLDVGLGYLTLKRKAGTLSGGEEQRIRLATQIGSKLSGVLYILDEPSIGLHARDQSRLLATLKQLRDLGNTIVVVEHDPHTIKESDWIIDIGPGAGKHGGKVMFKGTPKQLLRSSSLTGKYLSGRNKVSVERKKKVDDKRYIEVLGAKEHNLKDVDVRIPLGNFVCVTGVSGSGKSSLVNDILAKALLKKLYKAKDDPGDHKDIKGVDHLNKVVLVDQSPIGRTPRSNPATYTGAFSIIRDLFAKTREAKIRGYGQGKFSFNVKGGRCESCEGQGVKKIEMFFLPDVYVECEDCSGTRYTSEVLEVTYKEKNIADILAMTVEEALEFFKNIPPLESKLRTLNEVGLGYVELGQPAPSLSGGEAQRIKLASELSRKSTGRSMYILDEPTTGLHPDDIKRLVTVLGRLVEKGNTVLTVEHNLEFISNCDWLIDMGPEGGEQGGAVVAEGSPKEVSKVKESHTGKYLRGLFSKK